MAGHCPVSNSFCPVLNKEKEFTYLILSNQEAMKLNKDAYNKIARQWAESRDNSFLSQLVIDFAGCVKYKGKILDIGCGTGYPIARYLSDKGFEITGIDITENLLAKAKALNLPNASFYLIDFFEFIPETKFDGVIAFDSFFHFPKEKQAEIYSRVGSWMVPEAYLLFTHGATEGETMGEMFGEEFYYSCLNTPDVHRLLENSGLEVVQSIENYTEKDMDRDLVILARKKE